MIRIALLFSLLLSGCVSSPQKTGYSLRKNVLFQEYSSSSLYCDIYQPRATNSPIVMVVKGGDWNARNGDLQAVSEDLAKHGFLVYAVTYRLSPRYAFPAQVEDLKNALKFIRSDAPARGGNTANIYAWGYSAGGHLALLAAFDPENGIRGVVASAAPTDLTEFERSPLVARFVGVHYSKKNAKIWEDASPVYRASESSPPVFLYHGTEDGLFDIDHMFALQEKLKEKNVPVTARAVPGQGHVSLYLLDQKSVNLGIEFLLDLVKKNGLEPSTADQLQPSKE